MLPRPALASPALLRATRSPAPVAQEMLVHFGIRKTGSSSIQETLFRAPDGALGDPRYLSYGIANSSLMVRNLFVAPTAIPASSRACCAPASTLACAVSPPPARHLRPRRSRISTPPGSRNSQPRSRPGGRSFPSSATCATP